MVKIRGQRQAELEDELTEANNKIERLKEELGHEKNASDFYSRRLQVRRDEADELRSIAARAAGLSDWSGKGAVCDNCGTAITRGSASCSNIGECWRADFRRYDKTTQHAFDQADKLPTSGADNGQ